MPVSAFGVEDSRLDEVSKAGWSSVAGGAKNIASGGKDLLQQGAKGVGYQARVRSRQAGLLARKGTAAVGEGVKAGATKVGQRWATLTPVQQGLTLGGGVGGAGVGTGFAVGGRKKKS